MRVENLINDAINEYSPNVNMIRKEKIRIVRGKIRREIRNELVCAVKAGTLGRLKKDGLKPEIFYHPDHKHEAIEQQISKALYAIQCISKVVAGSSRT